jgi:hypothetical protein
MSYDCSIHEPYSITNPEASIVGETSIKLPKTKRRQYQSNHHKPPRIRDLLGTNSLGNDPLVAMKEFHMNALFYVLFSSSVYFV